MAQVGDSYPFIISECDSSGLALVNTKSSANQHIPILKDYPFRGCILFRDAFIKFENRIRNFQVRADDVWVLSYPKSGTTWIQNIVFQLKNGLNASREPLSLIDAQYLEWPLLLNSNRYDEVARKRFMSLFANSLDELNAAASPRIIKSHLPPNLLPVELWTVRPKMIYITRNPKDVAVSYFHMLRNDFHLINLTWEMHIEMFLKEKTLYSPFSAQVLSLWELRHLDNFLFLTYEELSAEPFKWVKNISKFLGSDNRDEDLRKLIDYVCFNNMQKMNTKELLITPERDPEYRFYRKGKVGGFKDEMNEGCIEKFDKWIVDRFQHTDFKCFFP